jgi:hypothetical protein
MIDEIIKVKKINLLKIQLLCQHATIHLDHLTRNI